MSSSTVERVVIHCASTARLSGDAARVSQAACSRGEAVQRPLGIELDDAARRHRAEPLAHVAFVETSRIGQVLARRAVELGERVEERGTVPDGDHHRKRAVVQQVEHAPGERLGTLRVERRLEHGTSSG